MHRRTNQTNLSPRLAVAALALAVCAGSCHRASQDTALHAVVTWPGGLTVDQLEFSVLPAVGGARAPLVPPTLRPMQAGASLPSPQDVIINLRDDQAGMAVRCRVSALSKASLAQLTESPTVTVKAHELVTCALDLPAGMAATNLPSGKACLDDRQCASGFCVDGLCCDARCDAACMACDLPASPGVCTFVAAGTTPRDPAQCAPSDAATCGNDGTCDGRGGCRMHATGTSCAAGRCDGASIVDAKACDGKGACVAAPLASCAPYVCDAAATPARCLDGCRSDADCVPGRACQGGSCGKRPDGSACVDGTGCQSGFCADSVCCNAACDGACLSCNQPGFPGMCRPVAAGAPDPRNKCSDSRAADQTSCGQSGACDGLGRCALYAAETVCMAPMCVGTGVMTAGTCDGMGVCQPGSALHCSPYACRDGHCNALCTGDGDCASGQSCDTAAMSCGPKGLGQSCRTPGECASTLCVDGVCCNEACDGACRSCALASSMGVCKNVAAGAADPRGTCHATDPSTCGMDGACDGNGACRNHAAGTVCMAESCAGSSRTLASRCDAQGACVAGGMLPCAPYLCNGTACFTSCGKDADCAPPNVCLGGACGLRASGMPCTVDAECGSSHCTDGVCCPVDDCGTCKACNMPGSPGRCAAVAALMPEPHGACPDRGPSSCGTDGLCDGAGVCHIYGAGTACGAATASTCMGSTLVLPSTCNGMGACRAGDQQPCAPYACAGGACKTMCTTDADCAAPTLCMGGSCGPKPAGASCTAGGDCASGNCTDGVCCATASCPSCQACNVPGRAGSCQAVAAGAPDPRGVCMAEAPATCGRTGACDGNGGCQRQLPGTVCAPGNCSGSLPTLASTCDGAGRCVAGGMGGDCAPYACQAGGCLSACMTDGDCVGAATCMGSVCRKRALGVACGGDGDCDSGHCVDGVCCSAGGCGACQACNVPGFVGACAAVGAGSPEPHGRCAAAAPASCGLDGACDGAGACRHWLAGTLCLPATCAARKRSQNPETCDGAGQCVNRGSVNCAPDDCDTTTGLCP